jgi:hypothetical protein
VHGTYINCSLLQVVGRFLVLQYSGTSYNWGAQHHQDISHAVVLILDWEGSDRQTQYFYVNCYVEG